MSNKHSAKQAIRNLKQIKNENIQSFNERLIDFAEQAFPDDAMDDRRTKDQILTIFIDGLYDPCIRHHVIRIRCNDIQDALMSAINENDLMAELERNMFITSQCTYNAITKACLTISEQPPQRSVHTTDIFSSI